MQLRLLVNPDQSALSRVAKKPLTYADALILISETAQKNVVDERVCRLELELARQLYVDYYRLGNKVVSDDASLGSLVSDLPEKMIMSPAARSLYLQLVSIWKEVSPQSS